MTRKSNAQISNFMDKHFLFKIYNDKYNLNYDYSEMTFSDLEAIIQSNYKYWEKKNKDNKMTTPIFNSWINWNAKFEQLKKGTIYQFTLDTIYSAYENIKKGNFQAEIVF